MTPVSPPTLKTRALRLLSLREHSRAELLRKLDAHQTDAERADGALTRALDDLTAKGFISDERVAASVLHQRAGRLGNARVLHELRGKGLPPEVVAAARDELKDTELARAQAVWQKKFGDVPRDAAERAKQMRFLAGRGFSAHVIAKVVQGQDDV